LVRSHDLPLKHDDRPQDTRICWSHDDVSEQSDDRLSRGPGLGGPPDVDHSAAVGEFEWHASEARTINSSGGLISASALRAWHALAAAIA
jgi:hypothetical protein